MAENDFDLRVFTLIEEVSQDLSEINRKYFWTRLGMSGKKWGMGKKHDGYMKVRIDPDNARRVRKMREEGELTVTISRLVNAALALSLPTYEKKYGKGKAR